MVAPTWLPLLLLFSTLAFALHSPPVRPHARVTPALHCHSSRHAAAGVMPQLLSGGGARPVSRHTSAVMVSGSSEPSALGQLWPNTLSKFWGLHAGVWSVAVAAFAFVTRSAVPLPLIVTNLVLAMLLYRNQDDLGVTMATAGGAYFAAQTAMLWLAPLSSLAPLISRHSTIRWLRLWHAALALGSFAFAIKAANKDRLFAENGCHVRGSCDFSAAATLPTLAMINKAAGAKIGERVGDALDVAAAEAKAVGKVLSVVDLSATPPEEALKRFAQEHGAFRVLVCGGDGSASWVLDAIDACQVRCLSRQTSLTPRSQFVPCLRHCLDGTSLCSPPANPTPSHRAAHSLSSLSALFALFALPLRPSSSPFLFALSS